MACEETISSRADLYRHYESIVRDAVELMGCEVTSNMTSLIVLNLPGPLAGRENELVQLCRAEGFGIWPTLSTPIQVRIGILNLLNDAAIRQIIDRFGDAIIRMGGSFDEQALQALLNSRIT